MGIKMLSGNFNNSGYSFLEYAINAEIEAITNEELQHKKEELLGTAKTGVMLCNNIEQSKEFQVNQDAMEYLRSQEGQINIIGYYKDILLTEMALYQLMTEGYLMPIQQRRHEEYWLKISSSNGSSTMAKIEMDLMPFKTFMIVRPK